MHEREPMIAAGRAGLRLWACPCCHAYGLQVGNVVLRLAPPDLGSLRKTLCSLATERLPERIAIVLTEGVSLLLTPEQVRGLVGVLAGVGPDDAVGDTVSVH